MRDVLCWVKSAVRIREEKKLQSCHGIDQHAGAGKPDRELLCRGEQGGVRSFFVEGGVLNIECYPETSPRQNYFAERPWSIDRVEGRVRIPRWLVMAAMAARAVQMMDS